MNQLVNHAIFQTGSINIHLLLDSVVDFNMSDLSRVYHGGMTSQVFRYSYYFC